MPWQRLAEATLNPIKLALVEQFVTGTVLSPTELNKAFGGDEKTLGVVAYHVRQLARGGFLEVDRQVPRRGAVETYYRWKAD